eukprot:760780-Hanusia_phi.AAC.1
MYGTTGSNPDTHRAPNKTTAATVTYPGPRRARHRRSPPGTRRLGEARKTPTISYYLQNSRVQNVAGAARSGEAQLSLRPGD